ncbi:unnamed protein product [Linum trigynum]|uniref:non-specific serine/threonine protein kinase n=1 Tax=Linum trigynum TaxID=586398 RepID=A0AAV2ETQ2_9ROSI
MKQNQTSARLSLLHPLLLLISVTYSPFQTNALGNNETDRLALLEFKKAITKDPDGVFHSWNSSLHFCNWAGITCNQEQRVTSLLLVEHSFQGTLSPHVGNLSFLQSINLTDNHFRGRIPPEFGNLARLRELVLVSNSLEGEIPINLTRCTQLRGIWLSDNGLVGKIPQEIGGWSNLEVIRMSRNNLSGPIPASLGNLSKLQDFGVPYNNLEGRIPDTVGQLSRMSAFVVGVNQLRGTIPPSLYNLSTMTKLTLIHNQFHGRIPLDIGFTLPNLLMYGINLNWMSGPIPSSFCNMTRMQGITMNENSFSGSIPSCFGSLPDLVYFHAGVNNLGTNSSDGSDFEFMTGLTNCSQLQELGVTLNNLGGKLPASVGNLSQQLYQLYLGINAIIGNIPEEIENLVSLNNVDLSNNLFTGEIPSYFGKFQSLQGLSLAGNQLSGQIPNTLGNISQLTQLDLSENQLEGGIPRSLGNCRQLNQLDLSSNKLTAEIPTEVFNLSSLSVQLNLSRNLFGGQVPDEIGSLENVEAVDLSYNFLTGVMPVTIGNCKSLKILNMQQNSFDGNIPSTLASLKVVESLDLSMNNFTGGIPPGLQDIQTMQYLNLSFNHLQGEVPTKGIFSNSSGLSVMGNLMLCNGISELRLPNCPTKAARKHKSAATIKLTLITVLVSLFIIFVSGLLLLRYKTRRSRRQTSDADSALKHFVMVSFKDLYQGTNGFSSENLIGSGGFGTIYKGVLEQMETPVAVKVLNNIQDKKAHKSLLAECNALKNVRHRNLVRILTYCSSLDHKGNDFKALVFEFMPNGSLEEWLHSDRNLTLIHRLNIAVDVASGLHYLHHLSGTPIVHCDLKPSNVLLDADMIAHVGDFGLARILSTDTSNSPSQSKSSTIGIKGTIGYAPPEYGMGSDVSMEGDMYSYGILLLEMFTGKRPTNEMFKEGINLCNFVKAAIPQDILSILDPSMFLPLVAIGDRGVVRSRTTGHTGDTGIEIEEMVLTQSARDCLESLLQTAISCSVDLSRERMKIADVARKLTSIRDSFVASTSIARRMPERG